MRVQPVHACPAPCVFIWLCAHLPLSLTPIILFNSGDFCVNELISRVLVSQRRFVVACTVSLLTAVVLTLRFVFCFFFICLLLTPPESLCSCNLLLNEIIKLQMHFSAPWEKYHCHGISFLMTKHSDIELNITSTSSMFNLLVWPAIHQTTQTTNWLHICPNYLNLSSVSFMATVTMTYVVRITCPLCLVMLGCGGLAWVGGAVGGYLEVEISKLLTMNLPTYV